MIGFCKFGTSCRYSHRQNDKIESIEKENAKLVKQVDDQISKIKELEGKILEIEDKKNSKIKSMI